MSRYARQRQNQLTPVRRPMLTKTVGYRYYLSSGQSAPDLLFPAERTCRGCGYHLCSCPAPEPEGAEREGWTQHPASVFKMFYYRDQPCWYVGKSVCGPEWTAWPGPWNPQVFPTRLAAQQHVEAAWAQSQEEPEVACPDGWEEVRTGKAYLQRERKWLVAQSPHGWVRITGCCDGYCIDAGIELAASVSVVDGPFYDTAREAMEAADAQGATIRVTV